MTPRAPRQELRQGKRGQLPGGLLDDKIVDDRQIGRREAEPGEHQIDAVHPKGKLILEAAHIRVLETWSIGDHKGSFALVDILESGQTTDGFAPPGMKI